MGEQTETEPHPTSTIVIKIRPSKWEDPVDKEIEVPFDETEVGHLTAARTAVQSDIIANEFGEGSGQIRDLLVKYQFPWGEDLLDRDIALKIMQSMCTGISDVLENPSHRVTPEIEEKLVEVKTNLEKVLGVGTTLTT